LFGQALQIGLDRGQGGVVAFLNRQIKQIAEIENGLFDVKNRINSGFYGAKLGDDRTGGLGFIPETGFCYFLLQSVSNFNFRREVKASPGPVESGP
jgi:hypothetical protein